MRSLRRLCIVLRRCFSLFAGRNIQRRGKGVGVLGAGTGASGPAPKWKPVLEIFTNALRPNATDSRQARLRVSALPFHRKALLERHVGLRWFHAGTCWRGWTETHEGSLLRQWLGPWIRPEVKSLPPASEHRAESPRRKQALASVRRRMRAVTGSSAEICFCRMRCGVASMLCAALSALIFSASSAALGCDSLPGSGVLPERPALSWSRKVGQFGQIGVVQEGLAQAGLVVAKLGLGDCQGLAGRGRIRSRSCRPGVPGRSGRHAAPGVPARVWDWRVMAPSRYTSGGNCG